MHKQNKSLSPEFTSSILIEFYQKDVTPTPSTFDRENYFVKIYVNDEPL